VVVSANKSDRYVVGVDFGTLSGRALVVRVGDGAEVATAVHEYQHGVIERDLPSGGRPLPPDWALQDPDDYREVLRRAVPAAVARAGLDPGRMVGEPRGQDRGDRQARGDRRLHDEQGQPPAASLIEGALPPGVARALALAAWPTDSPSAGCLDLITLRLCRLAYGLTRERGS
jgi:hypothetical protein